MKLIRMLTMACLLFSVNYAFAEVVVYTNAYVPTYTTPRVGYQVVVPSADYNFYPAGYVSSPAVVYPSTTTTTYWYTNNYNPFPTTYLGSSCYLVGSSYICD